MVELLNEFGGIIAEFWDPFSIRATFNRFDSYGTEINDSSISLRLDFPVSRFVEARQQIEEGKPIPGQRSASPVPGADAQTLSWAYVLVDFPFLRQSNTPAAKVIAAAQGNVDLLKSQVFKVSHHGSKHGVNLELVERIDSNVTLVSSVGGAGEFHFPHDETQELIREALDPTTDNPRPHPKDFELGVFYTSDQDEVTKSRWGRSLST